MLYNVFQFGCDYEILHAFLHIPL